jgi:1-acyl-sn-glycerol-3-phosphate acyltransferase
MKSGPCKTTTPIHERLKYTQQDGVKTKRNREGGSLSESIAHRSIVVTSQYAAWLFGQLLRLRFSVHSDGPTRFLESNSGHCMILAPTHKTMFDPWLLMISLSFRQFKALVPVRVLATQDPRGPLKWFMPLIKIVYWLGGVIELPPEDQDDRSLPEKLRGILVALKHGDVVMIFPEGVLWRRREPPVGKFASGVVYVYRRLGSPIVPIAVWMSERSWPRRRYAVQLGSPVRIPDGLDQEAGAAWLRDRVVALYQEARQREER